LLGRGRYSVANNVGTTFNPNACIDAGSLVMGIKGESRKGLGVGMGHIPCSGESFRATYVMVE